MSIFAGLSSCFLLYAPEIHAGLLQKATEFSAQAVYIVVSMWHHDLVTLRLYKSEDAKALNHPEPGKFAGVHFVAFHYIMRQHSTFHGIIPVSRQR